MRNPPELASRYVSMMDQVFPANFGVLHNMHMYVRTYVLKVWVRSLSIVNTEYLTSSFTIITKLPFGDGRERGRAV